MSLAIGWRRTLVKLVAAAIVLALYGFARPPRLAGSESAEMAARFRFEPSPLPELSGPRRTIRGWTLAVGAADLDGDERPEIYFANDFGPDCLLENLSSPGHLRFARLLGER